MILMYWLGFTCVFLLVFLVLFIVLFAKETCCSSKTNSQSESANAPEEPIMWPKEQHVFEPTIANNNETKVCLMVLSDVQSKDQIQYQKLWQQWHHLLGRRHNITTYLLVANKRISDFENIPSISFDCNTRLVMFNDMEDSLVPGILKKTVRLLNCDLFTYDWYVRTTAATFFDPQRLQCILSTLPYSSAISSPILAGSIIQDSILGKFVQGRCMIWNPAFTKRLREEQSRLFASPQADDIVLSQSFSDLLFLSLPDIVLPMRSTRDTFEQEYLTLQQKCKASSNWAAINSINNACSSANAKVDRTVDLALFGHFLFERTQDQNV